MDVREGMQRAAMAALCGVAGWWLRPLWAPSEAPTPPTATRPAAIAAAPPTAPPSPEPLIALAHDGNVTLRVEQQPLAWVLEEIARQSGAPADRALAARTAAKVASAPVGTAAALDCAEPAAPKASSERAQQLLQAIEGGAESARYDGLIEARGSAVPLPDARLKTLFETDASDRVRLLALANYLEPRSGDAAALRSALQEALYVPNGAVQAEARRLLEQLQDYERVDAGSAQSPAGP